MFRVRSDAVKSGIDQIRIPCRNGLNFKENTQIHFDVTPDVGMADLKNAFVEAEINLNGSDNAPCAQLFKDLGASSVVLKVVLNLIEFRIIHLSLKTVLILEQHLLM